MNRPRGPQLSRTGKTGLSFASAAELRRLSLEMVHRSRLSLDLVSRNLDPAVFDNRDFVTAVKNMVTKNPKARVRIIVLQPQTLIGTSHRLIDLSQRLSSYISIRRPGLDHADFGEAMMICDRRDVIHRPLSDRLEGIAYFDAPGRAAQLLQTVGEIWEFGEPDPNFRQLLL